jgi:hypothetical protein
LQEFFRKILWGYGTQRELKQFPINGVVAGVVAFCELKDFSELGVL